MPVPGFHEESDFQHSPTEKQAVAEAGIHCTFTLIPVEAKTGE
jgi:hypothetical protein